MKKIETKSKLLITLAGLISPSFVFADVEILKPSSMSLQALINSGSNWLLGFAGILAILLLTYGGFQYISSAGNTESAQGAKKTLTYATLGLLVIILARVVMAIVVNTLGLFV